MNPLYGRTDVSGLSPENAERPMVNVSSAQRINSEDETVDPEATERTFKSKRRSRLRFPQPIVN